MVYKSAQPERPTTQQTDRSSGHSQEKKGNSEQWPTPIINSHRYLQVLLPGRVLLHTRHRQQQMRAGLIIPPDHSEQPPLSHAATLLLALPGRSAATRTEPTAGAAEALFEQSAGAPTRKMIENGKGA